MLHDNSGDAVAAYGNVPGVTGHAKRYLIYVVALTWLVLVLRSVDLLVISVLMPSIKTQFTVSNTQLGLLSGFAFSLFYGLLAVPIAWLADRTSRARIISISVFVWSSMTALSGMANTFGHLLLARVGVGLGEAGGTAPVYALVADYAPANKRASVFAILNSSVPIGVLLGFLLGGYVSSAFGWRYAFLFAGIPGLAVALLAQVTLREPVRADSTTACTPGAPLIETLRYLFSRHSYCHFVLGSAVFTLGSVGSGIWISTYFIQFHHMQPSELGVWLALLYGGGGLVGALGGGYLTDHVVNKGGDQRWYAWMPGISSVAILPFTIFVYSWPSPRQALLVHLVTTILAHVWAGPVYGTVQGLAGKNRRAVAAAVNSLLVSFLAYGLGPLLVGVASDHFRASLGQDALRYSIMLLAAVAYTWAGIHFLLAGRTLRADLALALTAEPGSRHQSTAAAVVDGAFVSSSAGSM